MRRRLRFWRNCASAAAGAALFLTLIPFALLSAGGLGSSLPALRGSWAWASRAALAPPAPAAPVPDETPAPPAVGPRTGRSPPVRVAVVIPFRDRDLHLEAFKAHWRHFANESRTVDFWDVYVVEQFDSEPFNRGWNFNVGLSVALRDVRASPDLRAWPAAHPVACAVIQDIDYLPDDGVDYADCPLPTQLSSEIDRYGWSVPYEESAGGIVAMAVEHWKLINGFSNEYFGWGCEDDDLFMRLNRTGLILQGLHIRRPPPGFGRFRGEYMHSLNHTKRISYPRAYARSLRLLAEMRQGSDRWTLDGLSNLQFRLFDVVVDRSQYAGQGVTYTRVKVRRGAAEHDLARLPLAFRPGELCEGGAAAAADGAPPPSWAWEHLGAPVPWTLDLLRRRVDGLACSGGTDRVDVVFMLVDLRLSVGKVLDDAEPSLLHTFYRSLSAPQQTGLIVVSSSRTRGELERAFAAAGRFWQPPSAFVVCRAVWRDIPRYRIFQARDCDGGRWHAVAGGTFFAYSKPRPSPPYVALCIALGKKDDTQRIVRGSGPCAGAWEGLSWENEQHIFVRAGGGRQLCVATRIGEVQPSVRALPAALPCESEGFTRDFSFSSALEAPFPSPVAVLCVAPRARGGSRVCVGPCEPQDGWLDVEGGCFPVLPPAGRRAYEVCSREAASEETVCQGLGCCPRDDGWGTKIAFSLPELLTVPLAGAAAPFAQTRLHLCVAADRMVRLAVTCPSPAGPPPSLDLLLPSRADILGHGSLLLLSEDHECTEFICADTVAMMADFALVAEK